MRFLFVDAITALIGQRIEGYRHFAATEPLQYRLPWGDTEVAPSAISEAIGQLASWLVLERNDFAARPVFLFADRIEVLEPVPVGHRVQLSATLERWDDESLIFSGEARLDDRVVQRIASCAGRFLPLAELEDPEITRQRFSRLVQARQEPPRPASGDFTLASLRGERLSWEPGSLVRTRLTLPSDAPFYPDHFPRRPVTPIVILNEMIGVHTGPLVELNPETVLRPRLITDIKIRSFIAPGETCETVIRLLPEERPGWVTTSAEIHKDGRPVMRGTYHYQLCRQAP